MDLADFIDSERKVIVDEWETFARSLLPADSSATVADLRDHADPILTAIVTDMRTRQTHEEQSEKSKGRGEAKRLGAIGELHAALRIELGFKLGQMVAEYRALRASVLRLWQTRGTDPSGVLRFNEAIDEALTEAVDQFTRTTDSFRDQSLGILGHDLRNPLAGIVTGATLLGKAPELSVQSAQVAARMLQSAQRMNRMIGDLLDLTRTRFGDLIPVVRAPIDLAPLCEQVIAELEGLRPEGLACTLDGDLRGEYDGDRIAQVLSNLLRNAIVYGSKDERVRLTAKKQGNEVVIAIHNGGPPLSPSVLRTIFEPMVRRPGVDPKSSGLGLGLYIASQIVAAHGGRIDVTSTADAGTTFAVRLPGSKA